VSDSQEPSYYEIALTHRQVLFGFVLLLGCVVAAFLGGVWMGKGGAAPSGTAAAEVATTDGSAADPQLTAAPDPDLPEINFFSGEETTGGQELVDEPLPAAGTGKSTTLRQDVDGGSAKAGAAAGTEPRAVELSEEAKALRRERIRARREAEEARAAQEAGAGAQPAPQPQATSPLPAKPQPAKPEPSGSGPTKAAPAPAASQPAAQGSAATDERFVVQVLSTRERDKAQDIIAKLRAGGYAPSLSSVEQGEMVMFRVRVGPYGSRDEAESVAEKVRRGFKLDTWVTAE
jgi:DedD protein